MGNKLSSTNIAEILEQHLKAITDVNDVIVRSNISADVVANINDNISPISEALQSLDTISEVLSSSKLNVIGNIKYEYGIKTVVNNLNELLTSFNEISIDDSKLNDFKKAVKPINEVIEAITSVSDKLSNMKIGSVFGNAKFNIAIKGIIENIKNVIEQLKSVDTDEINDEHFKALSSAISSIVQLSGDLVKIGTIAPLLVALSPSIILAVKIIILINKQFSTVGKKGAQGALNAAIIGRALAEFAKGILVFLIASLGGVVFILGVVALLAMKVFMSVFFLLFNEKQMKNILTATIVIMSMSKAIMLISMVVMLWVLTGQLIIEEWKNILITMGFVMLAVVVFVLFGLLSQFIKQGNKTMHQLALTLILLSLTVVLWALTGELIVEQQENIFTVVKFVIVALVLFTIIGLLGKIINTGAKELILIALVLVVLSLTVLLWASTGEYIMSKWKEILIVGGFVLLTIGLFALLALAGNILKNGAKTVLLMVLALALISVVILLWAFIGETVIKDYESILAVMGFVAIASLMMFILGKIYSHVLKGMIVAILISAALFVLGVVAALAVQVGKMMLENWGGILMLVGFIIVIVGIFAILGIPAVFAYVVLGAIVMAIIGTALLLFSVSMLVFVLTIKLFEFEDVLKMMALIGGLGAAIAALGLLMPLIMLGSVAMVAMGAALMVFVVPILIFAAVLAILKKIKATEEDVKKPIQMMGTLISEINNVFGNDALIAIPLAAAKVMALVPVALAVGIIAETLQNLANLSIATAFNNEGKPIKFTKMKATDFALAGQNAIGMIKIMASIFGDETTSVKILGKNISIVPLSEKELEGISNKSKRKIRQLSKITGFIGNIAETLQNIASLRLATEFNSDGKPIKFRNMKGSDFATAGENAAAIVKILASLFTDEGFNGELLGEKVIVKGITESDLNDITGKAKRKMRKLSKITGYIGTITNTIGAIATLNIPVGFDEDGKANKFEKITATQLKGASENVAGIIKMLGGLLSGDGNGNAFDVIIGGETIRVTPLSDSELDSFTDRTRRKMEKLNDITLSVQDITGIIGEITKIDIPSDFDPSTITTFVNGVITGLSEIELDAFQNSIFGISFSNGSSGIFTSLMSAIGNVGNISNLVKEVASLSEEDVNLASTKISSIIKTLASTFSGLVSGDRPIIPEFNRDQENRLQKFNEFVTSIKDVSEIDTARLTTVTDAIKELQRVSSNLYGDLGSFIENLNDNITTLKNSVNGLREFIEEYNEGNPRISGGVNNNGVNNNGVNNNGGDNNGGNRITNITGTVTVAGLDTKLNDIYTAIDGIEDLLTTIQTNTRDIVTNTNN